MLLLKYKYFIKLILIFLFFLFNSLDISNLIFFNVPLVSIIIPVNHNFECLFYCIYSIIKNVSSISFEIIVINDLSNNKNKLFRTKYFNNYTNIYAFDNNKINNFHLNCNQAVKYSKGKYI